MTYLGHVSFYVRIYAENEREVNQYVLTINKTYCISSDDCEHSATTINLRKENGCYNFFVTNFRGQKLEFQLNDVLAGELFTALKELGNFM